MATTVTTGISTKLDSFTAGKEAARYVHYQLSRREPDILIVFISTIFDQQETIKGIRSIIKDAPLVGCSTAGNITTSGAIRDSVMVCAIVSSSMSFSCGVGTGISKNPRLAGRKAIKQSLDLKDIKKQVYIIFSDFVSGNSTDVLRGIQEILGTGFPIIGGSAIDNLQFQRSFQYLNNNIYTDSVVGLLIGGDTNIGLGKAHGWQPIGKPHKITRARLNVVREIDRRRAIQLYEEYLGKTSDELKVEGIAKIGASYPLGMRIKEQKEYLIRTPLKIDDSGGLILSAEIPEREDINLMIGDKNLTLDATKKACIEALKNINKSRIKFAIVFSDVARLQLLREDSQKEIEIIKDILGKDIPFFGCYTYGEYAPINIHEYTRQSYFQNQTISIAVFS